MTWATSCRLAASARSVGTANGPVPSMRMRIVLVLCGRFAKSGRQGEGETQRSRFSRVSLSPPLLVSPSPCLPLFFLRPKSLQLHKTRDQLRLARDFARIAAALEHQFELFEFVAQRGQLCGAQAVDEQRA